jgi:GntR family transcriptional regulator / MocR family aminotransferase
MIKHIARLPNLQLDAKSATALHRQLYEGIRSAILAGQIIANTRLPSSRTIAHELGISRNTVLNAFEQLLAEGYLEGQPGSGTYVSHVLPDDLLRVPSSPAAQPPAPANRRLSRRGSLLAATPVSVARDQGLPRAFRPGLPAFDTFPFDVWTRLVARHWKQPPPELLSYGEPAGYWPLREAIAAYLHAARGVQCTTDQVIVVAGSQQGLDLAARVLLDPGDHVWIEDPGYVGARGALCSAGAQLVPVPIDQEGLRVAVGIDKCPDARIAYVTSWHQFPLGVTMSLSRRLALLDWARRADAWLLEDDYDSEYRFCLSLLKSRNLGFQSTGLLLQYLKKNTALLLSVGFPVVTNQDIQFCAVLFDEFV